MSEHDQQPTVAPKKKRSKRADAHAPPSTPSASDTTPATTATPTDYRVIPIALIRENPSNPRKTFDGIDDLAASIKKLGQIVPGLARPHPSEEGAFELVAGHRRFRACAAAGVETFRVVVAEMDDATALKVMLVENGQRADVPPLEEAESYRQLRDVHGLSVAQVASEVGRSEAHIYQRLKLTELVPGVQALLRNGNLLTKTALLFARLDQAGQLQALKHVTDRFQFLIEEGAVLNHREVDHFVLLGSRKLKHARWTLDDAQLVQQAGSCLDCGKRTAAQAQLFQIGDTDTDDACLDAGCWQGKVQAAADRELTAAMDNGQDVIDPKEARDIFRYGGALTDTYVDAEESIVWILSRQYRATDAERARATAELFPELAAFKEAEDAWNKRAGAFLEEHELDELPEDYELEPEEPTKTFGEVLGLDHPAIRVTLDKDGHARRLIAREDLAAVLWERGMKNAFKILQPQHHEPPPGSPQGTQRERERERIKQEKERVEVRTFEAAAVRKAALEIAGRLSVEELVLAVTLMVCRYGSPGHSETERLRKELGVAPGKKKAELYLEAPNQALWQHVTDKLIDKRTKEKDRLLLALRVLMERPVLEPSHDLVLREVLGLDVNAARKQSAAQASRRQAETRDRVASCRNATCASMADAREHPQRDVVKQNAEGVKNASCAASARRGRTRRRSVQVRTRPTAGGPATRRSSRTVRSHKRKVDVLLVLHACDQEDVVNNPCGDAKLDGMVRVIIDDEDVAALGRASRDDAEEHLRFVMAVKLYELGEVSMGKAAELCGKNKIDFMDDLIKLGVPVINYSKEEIESGAW